MHRAQSVAAVTAVAASAVILGGCSTVESITRMLDQGTRTVEKAQAFSATLSGAEDRALAAAFKNGVTTAAVEESMRDAETWLADAMPDLPIVAGREYAMLVPPPLSTIDVERNGVDPEDVSELIDAAFARLASNPAMTSRFFFKDLASAAAKSTIYVADEPAEALQAGNADDGSKAAEDVLFINFIVAEKRDLGVTPKTIEFTVTARVESPFDKGEIVASRVFTRRLQYEAPILNGYLGGDGRWVPVS